MFYYIIVSLLFSPLLAMEPRDTQLQLCATRNVTYARPIREEEKKSTDATQQAPDKKPCPFCNPEILKKNHVFSEDTEKNIRIIFNKFPYPSWDQGIHILSTLITHKAHPNDITHTELAEQVAAAHHISEQLYDDAYTQEYFTNWGAIAGQSVPHWHSHIVSYTQEPCSLSAKIQHQKNPIVKTIEEAFAKAKAIIETPERPIINQCPYLTEQDQKKCVCCT